MSEGLFAGLAGVALFSLGFVLWTYAVTWRKIRPAATPCPVLAPPISILKPIKGLDDGLFENLVALVQQEYPIFELLIGIEDPFDPAVRVAKRLQLEFPEAPIRICLGSREGGLNPKVRILEKLIEVASHDWVLISDSNVRPERSYLSALAVELRDPKVGLVSNLLSGEGERSLGALLENLHANTFFAATIAAADRFGHPCVIGKSMLFRRSVFEELGGFATVRNLLAEDYVIGQRFSRAGWKVALSGHVLPTRYERRSLQDFFHRHLRWDQMRRRVNIMTYLGEPLLNPMAWWSCLGVWALARADQRWLGMSLLAMAGKLAADVFLVRRLTGRWPGLTALWVLPVKDLLAVVLWGVGFFSRKIHWRGNLMRIEKGSFLGPWRPVTLFSFGLRRSSSAAMILPHEPA